MKDKKIIYTFALYAIFLLIVILAGIFGKDKWYIIACSLVAVVYLLLLNDGNKIGYLLCAVYSIAYGVISFTNGLYAGAFYHIAILLPSALYRFAKRKTEQTEKINVLHLPGWLLCCGATVLLSVALFFLLRFINDPQPLLDGATLSVSVITAVLMAKKYIEMWAFNLISSLIYIAVWMVQFFSFGVGLSIVALQTVVSIINIRGLILWGIKRKPADDPHSEDKIVQDK